jgi:uncharacterized repeat protein (TIGR02543 family)
MRNKRIFSRFLLAITGGLFIFGISGCDNGTTNITVTQYTVTLDANGGQVSPGTETVEEGKTLSSLPTPTKTSGDTVFQGWYIKNGINDNDWGTPFTVVTPIITDITVYAKWGSVAPTKYTVTFNPDGGTVNPAYVQVNSGDPIGILPVPTKQGNTFEGWWTAQSGGGVQVIETTTVPTDITVYAKWMEPLKIIYNCEYTQTSTHTDNDNNKSTQYFLSISYEAALDNISDVLGESSGDIGSLFWNTSELSVGDNWVILEYIEYVFSEGQSSRTNQVRLISKNGAIFGKRWNWQRQ